MKWLLPARYIVFFLFVVFSAKAQKPIRVNGGGPHPAPVATTSSMGYSGTGSNIDVVYHRANWRINPDSTVKAIGGSVTTYFKTIQGGVTTITFDLNNVFTVSATYHGSAITVTRPVANQIRLALPVSLPIDRLDSVTITYNGTPPAISAGGGAIGYQRATYGTTPNTQNYIYTLSESYEDRDWWPCKADMQDKIDSMDIIVSTRWTGADTFWVASNGKLVDSAIQGNSRVFTFKTRYPMASYLVSLGVARYNRYYTSVNVGGTNTQVAYYLFRNKTTTTYNNIQSAMNSVNGVLTAFSTKFGDYPFKNEKHGYYEGIAAAAGAGGMEHQTFSAMASNQLTNVPTLIHELAHQWFGDKVTFATWNHLWLAEGFGRYSVALAGELVPALGISPVTQQTTSKNETRTSYSTTNLVIPAAGIANSDAIWTTAYGGVVYSKGAMILSMLRKLVGDTRFYQAMSNYMNDPLLAYKSAVTDDLKRHFEAVANYDLDPFFNQWVYGVGHADFAISWNNSGRRIAIRVASQTKSAGATAGYFPSPVVVRVSNGLTGASLKDTTIVIYSQGTNLISYAGNGILAPYPQNTLAYDLSFTPHTTAATAVTFDPNAETISTGTPTKDNTINPFAYTTLPVTIIDFKGQQSASGNHLSLLLTPTEEKITVIAERSENGNVFSAIGEMTKTTSSSNSIQYYLADKNTLDARVHYYRAKIVDEKGTIEYSKMVRLKNGTEGAGGVSIYPTVVMGDLKIVLSEGWEQMPVSITVFNNVGTVVKKEKLNAGTSQQIPVHHLPSGNYTLDVMRSDGQTINKRFVIMR